MTDILDRRAFIRRLLTVSAAGAAWGLAGCGSRPTPTATPAITPAAPTRALPASATAIPLTTRASAATTSAPSSTVAPTAEPAAADAAYLAVARGAGADPAELTRRAIAALGGIERFVKSGADVIVKPNICNAYHGPEYASTTNPDVVAAIVALCLGAGAKRVRVMDFPFGGTPQASYETSGIAAAVKAAGGEMETMNRLKFNKTAIPQGKILRSSNIYGDILDADTVINVPIAKTHGSATLTLGMKNLMGVIQDRNALHARGLHQSHRRSQLSRQAAAYHRGRDPHPDGQRPDRRQSGRRQAAGHHHRQRRRGRGRRLCHGPVRHETGRRQIHQARRRNGAGDDGLGQYQDRGDRGLTGRS